MARPDDCIQEANQGNGGTPECGDETGSGLGGPGLAISPDNANVYVTGQNDIAEFARTPVQFSLNVSRQGAGNGTVTDDTGSISCPPTCSHAYPQGSHVTLTANPASGSAFAGWSGGGCSGTGACSVTTNSDQNVTAAFETFRRRVRGARRSVRPSRPSTAPPARGSQAR